MYVALSNFTVDRVAHFLDRHIFDWEYPSTLAEVMVKYMRTKSITFLKIA